MKLNYIVVNTVHYEFRTFFNVSVIIINCIIICLYMMDVLCDELSIYEYYLSYFLRSSLFPSFFQIKILTRYKNNKQSD